MRKALEEYSNDSFMRSSPIDKFKLLTKIYPWIFSSDVHAHSKSVEIKKALPEKVYDTYFKFGFVRNPWDWQVSLYEFMLKNTEHHQHELIKKMTNFEEYLNWRIQNELRFQKDFFYDKEGNCLVDFIGRLEKAVEDFDSICKQLKMDARLPFLNKSRDDRAYLKYYNEKTLELVNQAFKEDIELFGYTKPTFSSVLS